MKKIPLSAFSMMPWTISILQYFPLVFLFFAMASKAVSLAMSIGFIVTSIFSIVILVAWLWPLMKLKSNRSIFIWLLVVILIINIIDLATTFWDPTIVMFSLDKARAAETNNLFLFILSLPLPELAKPLLLLMLKIGAVLGLACQLLLFDFISLHIIKRTQFLNPDIAKSNGNTKFDVSSNISGFMAFFGITIIPGSRFRRCNFDYEKILLVSYIFSIFGLFGNIIVALAVFSNIAYIGELALIWNAKSLLDVYDILKNIFYVLGMLVIILYKPIIAYYIRIKKKRKHQ